jgi:thioredoxin 1
MFVKFIESESEWNQALEKNTLLIADFTASWCGPCKQISPIFEKLAEENKDKMGFVKVDVDQQNSLAAKYGVSAMPTFKVFLQGREIKEMRGADRNGLQTMINESIQFFNQKLKQHEEKKNQPVAESREELLNLSIKELKQMIQSRGQSLVGLVEKGDLVDKLKSIG